MLEFAMVALMEPRLMLLDEPCAGLSPAETQQLMEVVRWSVDHLGASALLIEHDLKLRRNLTPWLAGVYVKAEERGRGIASQLVNRVVEEAAALGVPELYLYTDTSQSLYARLGWQVVEELVYEELPVVVMKYVIRA